MKIYIVGHHGPEHNEVISIHKTRKGAAKAWNEIRLELIKEARSHMKNSKYDKGMWRSIVKNLSRKDPEKIDNYPHETPYIQEHEIVE